MKFDATRALIVYSGVLTIAVGASLIPGAQAGADKPNGSFDTIDVKRINVREDDGTLRMIVSNTSRSPGIIMHGKERPHPSGNRGAGIIFYNEEGSENGGLTFRGSKAADGTVSAGGHLSFDQYEQDQVIQLTQSERAGRRWAAMVVSDRPDTPLDFDLAERFSKLPQAEQAEMVKKFQAEGTFGRERLYVGKTPERASAVTLSDAQGRPRLVLKVAADGAASIDFLDAGGKTVRSFTPAAQ